MLEDKLILLRFKHGSSESFERIYNKCETYLIKYSFYYTYKSRIR